MHRNWAWRPMNLVNTVVSKGIMLVCKPRNESEERYLHTYWRLFSESEVVLISNREAPCKQHAQRIFKYIIKYMTKDNPSGEERIVNSYHCKTILMWACEKLPPELWTLENLGIRVLRTDRLPSH